MKRNLKDMTDAEYGKYIREQTKAYNERAKVKARLLNAKIKKAKVTVTDEEVEKELKRLEELQKVTEGK